MPFALRRFRHKLWKAGLRVPAIWWFHRGCRPNDVFLGAYPRAGHTWLKFLLYEALTGKPCGFEDVKRQIRAEGKELELLPGHGRLIATHCRYRREYRKAVYLVRDCRDVVLSEYAYEKARGLFVGDFDQFLTCFLQTDVNGFGPWHVHVKSWLEAAEARRGDLKVVRFEDLRADTEGVLGEILEHFGVRPDPQAIRESIANNSVAKMREKEDNVRKSGAKNASGRALLSTDGASKEEGRFVREGAVGGWRNRLTDAQVRLLEQYVGGALSSLGYPIEGVDAKDYRAVSTTQLSAQGPSL